MSFTWDVVDAIVGALRDKHVTTTSDRERFAEAYAAWKRRLLPVVRKRAFNRINLGLAVYHVAHRDTFEETLDIPALVDEASGLDFDALLGPGKAIDLHASTVREAIVQCYLSYQAFAYRDRKNTPWLLARDYAIIASTPSAIIILLNLVQLLLIGIIFGRAFIHAS